MSRVLFIYRVDRSDPSNAGVVQKLVGQVEAFQSLGWDVDYIMQDGGWITLHQKKIKKLGRNRSLSAFRFYNNVDQYVTKVYDLIIARYGLSTPSFLGFLKVLRAKYSSAKILIDLPTYPYEAEWKGRKDRGVIFIDRIYRKQLKQYVDGVLHSGWEGKIFDIPTLRFTNGISKRKIKKRIPRLRQKGMPMELIAIGKWQYWHGLDRLIQGIAGCKEKVHLKIVGEGPVIPQWKSLVASLGLNEAVLFLGVQTGVALDQLLDEADVGIGTLAPHRKGLTIDSSLKHREYVAHGLPFLLAGPDSDVDDAQLFVHYVSRSDEAIDMAALAEFYESLDLEKIASEMRSFAIHRLTWRQKVSSLIKTLGIS